MYFLLFLFLSRLFPCVHSFGSDDPCGLLKFKVVVSVELSGKGFHREVTTTVNLGCERFRDVRVLLVYKWPRDVYVDPFQVASLSSQSDWKILFDSAIDLEAPAHKAPGFRTYIYLYKSEPPSDFLTTSIPFHGRYHEPSFDGESYSSANIDPPDVLLRSENCDHVSNLEPYSVLDAPCEANSTSICSWVKIKNQYKILSSMRVQLPIGDGYAAVPVCVTTLLVTMICCGVLCKYMWKHQMT